MPSGRADGRQTVSKKNACVAAFDYAELLASVKSRIQIGQTRAISAVNVELIRLYWDIGRIIDSQQQLQGWGAAVIPRLANELRNELPELKGFSERNIKYMLAFFREYRAPEALVRKRTREVAAFFDESVALFGPLLLQILFERLHSPTL
jgi:hypothetical protein